MFNVDNLVKHMRFAFGCVAVALACLMAGCESDSDSGSSNIPDPDVDWTGTWEGIAGTTDAATALVLEVDRDDGYASGKLFWPRGDERHLRGTAEGNSMVLSMGYGDDEEVWSLTKHGPALSGTGRKPDGTKYSVSLTKRA